MARNPKFGKWTEKETNWSIADTEFLRITSKNSSKHVPITLKQLTELHKSLPY